MIKRIKKKWRMMVYGAGQHELVCMALQINPDYDHEDPTAYEAVCKLMTQLDLAIAYIESKTEDDPEAQVLMAYIDSVKDSPFTQLHGTGNG